MAITTVFYVCRHRYYTISLDHKPKHLNLPLSDSIFHLISNGEHILHGQTIYFFYDKTWGIFYAISSSLQIAL